MPARLAAGEQSAYLGDVTGPGQHASLDQLIQVNRQRWGKTLAVEISYSLEGHAIHFDLLLFTEDSIKRLTNKIDYLME